MLQVFTQYDHKFRIRFVALVLLRVKKHVPSNAYRGNKKNSLPGISFRGGEKNRFTVTRFAEAKKTSFRATGVVAAKKIVLWLFVSWRQKQIVPWSTRGSRNHNSNTRLVANEYWQQPSNMQLGKNCQETSAGKFPIYIKEAR